MSSTITLSTNTSPPVVNTYTLIPMPDYPGFESIDLSFMDTVGKVVSPFVPSSVQTQSWPGADGWRATFTLPKMPRYTAAAWRGWLAELRGIQNVFQLGDPLCTSPMGLAEGTPVCAPGNTIMSTSLLTSGWTPNVDGQLLAGDYIQVGYRLYMVCETVNSDSDGDATIIIWPSLREIPTSEESSPPSAVPLTLTNTKGVFRLSSNVRTWHLETSKLLQFSVQCEEVR